MTPQALLLCPIVGALALVLAVRGMPGRERNIMVAGFLAHVAASIALVLYHESSGGDMTVYRFYGAQIARALDLDFVRYAPEVVRLALHRESALPFPVLLEGTSSGTMSAYAGMLIFLVGNTTYGTCLLVSFFSYAGMMSMYRSLRGSLEERERTAVLGALLFMPSATFWTSGIVKEAFLMGFLGFLIGAAYDVLARRRMLRLPLGALGAIGVSITKPYVMFPLVIATAGYLFARRGRKLSLGYKVAAVIVAVGGVIGVSRLFPQFGLDNHGEAIATQQRNGVLVAHYAGSYVGVGDEDVQTLGGQIRFLPLGIVNALMRPAFFDIRNAMSGVAAVEMTVIVGGLIALAWKHGLRTVIDQIRSHPPLMFAAVFILAFGAAVGVSTTNLGTLSRYRVPMMPFYIGAVAILRARLTSAASARVAKPVAPKRTVPLTREEKLRIIARRGQTGRLRA